MFKYCALLIFAVKTVSVFADCPFRIEAGLESYYFIRNREGGTHQNGMINGLRVKFDRIKSNGLYFGVDYLYASGELNGDTAMGRPLRSELTDSIFEARLGLTLQQNRTLGRPFFTPFGGWGHFVEINDFCPPSPLPCKFTDTFNYIVAGFLSGTNLNSLVSMGINFKLMFMQNAKSKISHDPIYNSVTLIIKEEINARLEAPFTFIPAKTLFGLNFLISPFFEFRHFGGREGFPFNFKDTKFYLIGTRLALIYRF